MSFRMNFILQCLSSLSWALMNYGLFQIVYQFTPSLTRDSGWDESEFFVFLGTVWIINSLMQTFFMANATEFSEMIRTGNLDFALLKPIDTQFLISFPRINWAQLANAVLGLAVVIYYTIDLLYQPSLVVETIVDPISGVVMPIVVQGKQMYFGVWAVVGYLFFLGCGTLIMYSVMITLASTSIWLGRNQNLHTFWFYITNFYRYPMEIYQRPGIGWSLWGTFTFIVPILVVSNIPARVLAQPLGSPWQLWEWGLACWTGVAAVLSVVASRAIFKFALVSYRSASS